MQNRHSEGDQHANIGEFALMIALVAVLLSASVLRLVAQLSGQ
jgi:Flp pilus assembly pilin Flp